MVVSGVCVMSDGLFANIHKKMARIAAGSGEKMAKKGDKDRPTAKDFKESAKTAKPRREMISDAMKDM